MNELAVRQAWDKFLSALRNTGAEAWAGPNHALDVVEGAVCAFPHDNVHTAFLDLKQVVEDPA